MRAFSDFPLSAIRPLIKPWGILLPLLALLLGSGCSTDSARAGRTAAEPSQSLTLLESQLLALVDAQQQLARDAARPDAVERDIERRFQQIAQDYNAVIARNPDHLETRLLYGKFLAYYGDNNGARDQFLVAAKLDPKVAVIHQQLGTLFAEEGDYTRALAYYINAVQLEPETPLYHFGLGQLLAAFREQFIADGIFSPEKVDASILEAFDTARRLDPDNLTFQMRYGEAFYDVAEADWEQALAHWQRLAAHPDVTPVIADVLKLHQARALTQLGRETEAESLLQQINTRALLQPLPAD